MSDPNVPGEGTPDTTPTEALQLADQEPIEVAPAAAPAPAAAQGTSHTRTILEVVGGVVAAGLIVVAGILGFAVGHATGGDDDRWSMTGTRSQHQDGPDAGAPGQGFGQQQGEQGFGQQQGEQGQGQGRGHDGDMGQGMGEGMGEGMEPRGIDPDGDNWTGQNQDQALPEQTLPVQPTPSEDS